MFTKLVGIRAIVKKHESHPYDPSDWRECQLLIEAVPEVAERFPEMAEVSPEWSRLVTAWPEILRMLDVDAPNWRNKTTAGRSVRAWNLIRQATGREPVKS